MKKFVTTLIALSILSAVPLAACKKRAPEPEHTCTWRTVREPDCTHDGLRERTCNCGKTGDETIPALGHSWTGDRNDEEHWEMCNRVGCGEERNRERHSFDNDGNCECGYKITYTQNLDYVEIKPEGETEITGYAVAGLKEGATDTNIVIPAVHEGKPVIQIAESAFYVEDGTSTVASITVPDSVTYIGETAFYGCEKLKTVKLGKGVKEFGDYAFYGSGITAIETPASVITFGKGVFYNCTSLVTAKINAAQTVGSFWFYGDTALEKIEIGTGVDVDLATPPDGSSQPRSFAGCTALIDFIINGKIKFEKYSFYNNPEESLNITFGDNITEIPAEALYPEAWSSSFGSVIKSIKIGKNVKKIGGDAFYFCDRVKTLILPDGLEEVGDRALSMSGLEELTVPKSFKKFGAGVTLPELKKVNYLGTVNDWVKIQFTNGSPMGRGADFYVDGKKVTDIVIDGVDEVPAYAFRGSNFTSVTLGESVKRIGQDAFSRPTNAGVPMPATIQRIVILSKQFSASASWGSITADCEIYYAGTPEEMLANFTVGANNIHWFKDKVHYFYSETGTQAVYEGASGWTYGGLWHYVDGKVTKW